MREYQSLVFLCCRALGLRDDEAEDVASETFLAAYKGIARYRGEAAFGTWLWKIAYHKGVSFIRKKGRRATLAAGFSRRLAGAKNPGCQMEMENNEASLVVWSAVKRLPKPWAVAVVLFYREEKSIKEIAKIIGKRQNTVKTYLFRARKELKRILGAHIGETADVSRPVQ